MIIKKREYIDMLSIEGMVIFDLFKFFIGWYGEVDGVKLWLLVYILDVFNYFLVFKDIIFFFKYFNEYKIGKVYEYFLFDWLKEVFYYFILFVFKFCLLKVSCIFL